MNPALVDGVSVIAAGYTAREPQSAAIFFSSLWRLLQHRKVHNSVRIALRTIKPPKVQSRQALTEYLIFTCRVPLNMTLENKVDHPRLWGPIVWRMLFYVSQLDQTPHFQEYWLKMMLSLPSVIPCDRCAQHLKQHYRATERQLLHCRNVRQCFQYLVNLKERIANTQNNSAH